MVSPMDNKFFEIKHVFPLNQISTFSRVFQNTTSDALSSKLNMDRCVSVMRGDNITSLKKFVSIVRKNNCDSEEYEIISSFYSHNQSSIDMLKTQVSQDSTGHYHNIIVSKVNSYEVVHKVPVDLWDLKYRVTCYKTFDLFSRADLSSLKTILVAMENFPLETYLLLYPFIGSILGITIFSYCFTYLSEGKFIDNVVQENHQENHS